MQFHFFHQNNRQIVDIYDCICTVTIKSEKCFFIWAFVSITVFQTSTLISGNHSGILRRYPPSPICQTSCHSNHHFSTSQPRELCGRDRKLFQLVLRRHDVAHRSNLLSVLRRSLGCDRGVGGIFSSLGEAVCKEDVACFERGKWGAAAHQKNEIRRGNFEEKAKEKSEVGS